MAVMDAQALTTDVEGLAFLADVLGAGPHTGESRFPVEKWMPAPDALKRVQFGTVEPISTLLDRVREHAD